MASPRGRFLRGSLAQRSLQCVCLISFIITGDSLRSSFTFLSTRSSISSSPFRTGSSSAALGRPRQHAATIVGDQRNSAVLCRSINKPRSKDTSCGSFLASIMLVLSITFFCSVAPPVNAVVEHCSATVGCENVAPTKGLIQTGFLSHRSKLPYQEIFGLSDRLVPFMNGARGKEVGGASLVICSATGVEEKSLATSIGEVIFYAYIGFSTLVGCKALIDAILKRQRGE